MVLALPPTRQPQLLANIFAAAEKLEKKRKKISPGFENKKTGVFILNQPVRSKFGRTVALKGGDAVI